MRSHFGSNRPTTFDLRSRLVAAGVAAAMSAARAPSTFSGLRAQRRRAVCRHLEGRMAAVCVRVTQLKEDLVAER
eukprot:2566518-Lingulodinium_polyedra.AAC.1